MEVGNRLVLFVCKYSRIGYCEFRSMANLGGRTFAFAQRIFEEFPMFSEFAFATGTANI
jgi:hypothetical protein